MIGWTGLAPWEFEFHFPGSLTSTFLAQENDAKRERALKRARDEIKIRNEKEKEAEQLRQEMAVPPTP